MITPRLTKPQWLELPHEVRLYIARTFAMPRSESGHIDYASPGRPTRILSDGHSNDDLSLVTLEALQNLLQSTESDFFKLFNTWVAQISLKLDEDQRLNSAEAQRDKQILESKINNWRTILASMRDEAINTGLSGTLTAIVCDTFNVQPVQAKDETAQADTGTKKRGRPAKSATN